jgi:hypothetical protein
MRVPNSSERIAIAIAAVLVSVAGWIAVSEPGFGPATATVGVATEVPGRSQTRLRVRVKAAEGRIALLENAIEARSAKLAELQASLEALDESVDEAATGR